MPELMTETRRTCSANLNWSRSYPSSKNDGTFYTVRYGRVAGGAYSNDFTCDCPAGQHGKACKHVVQAKQDKCTWGWEAFCGDTMVPNADGTCPVCGEPTEVILVGV